MIELDHFPLADPTALRAGEPRYGKRFRRRRARLAEAIADGHVNVVVLDGKGPLPAVELKPDVVRPGLVDCYAGPIVRVAPSSRGWVAVFEHEPTVWGYTPDQAHEPAGLLTYLPGESSCAAVVRPWPSPYPALGQLWRNRDDARVGSVESVTPATGHLVWRATELDGTYTLDTWEIEDFLGRHDHVGELKGDGASRPGGVS